MRSVPPYSRGGTLSAKGAIWAIFMGRILGGVAFSGAQLILKHALWFPICAGAISGTMPRHGSFFGQTKFATISPRIIRSDRRTAHCLDLARPAAR